MFDQLFSRGGERSHQAEHTSPTHESGTPVSPHMPISQCIAGEVAGIGISIGLISVGPRDGEEDASSSSTAQTRGWNASGFLAAIFGIGIALSFWTPKNLWVIMGGFGLRRERRQQQKNREISLDAREACTNDRIAVRSKGKGKQRAIEGSESEGESSSVGESTPLLLNGGPAASYTKLPPFDTNIDPKHGTYTRIGEEDSVPTSPLSPIPDNLLTTIEEDIEPRSLPRNTGFPLPGQLRTEQPTLAGPEEVSTPDSEGQCPWSRRSSTIVQIQPLPASINIPTQKPASIRRPRSQESLAESPPRDSPASSYRSRSLPRAFAMRQAAAAAEKDAAEAREETEAKEAEEARIAIPEPEVAKVEEPKPAEETKEAEETPVFNLIPATPATIPQEVRDAAEEAMKETQEEEARGRHLSLSGPSQSKPEQVRSDSASIRSRKHSRANSLSDLKEEPEEVEPVVRPSDGSLTVDYKGKQPAGVERTEEVGLAVEHIVSSPDQLSLHEDSPSEDPKSPQDDSPSHPPPPSRGGSILDDGKSINSVDPKTSPSRKNSFRRLMNRKPSSDTMKKEGSLRRSLTSVIPGGKSKKRDKSLPPSSTSLGEPTPPPTPPDGRPSRDEGEASIRPSSRRSERSISRSWSNFKMSGDKKRNPFAKQASDNEAPADANPDPSETVKPSEPAVPAEESSASAPAPAGPSQTADEVHEEKPKRRPSWWGVAKDLKRKNSIAQSVKGEEGVTRPSTATSISQPEGKGKEVERVGQSVEPTPESANPVEADKGDAPVSTAVEPLEPKANDPVSEVANGEAKKATESPSRGLLKTRVKSFMAWRK